MLSHEQWESEFMLQSWGLHDLISTLTTTTDSELTTHPFNLTPNPLMSLLELSCTSVWRPPPSYLSTIELLYAEGHAVVTDFRVGAALLPDVLHKLCREGAASYLVDFGMGEVYCSHLYNADIYEAVARTLDYFEEGLHTRRIRALREVNLASLRASLDVLALTRLLHIAAPTRLSPWRWRDTLDDSSSLTFQPVHGPRLSDPRLPVVMQLAQEAGVTLKTSWPYGRRPHLKVEFCIMGDSTHHWREYWSYRWSTMAHNASSIATSPLVSNYLHTDATPTSDVADQLATHPFSWSALQLALRELGPCCEFSWPEAHAAVRQMMAAEGRADMHRLESRTSTVICGDAFTATALPSYLTGSHLYRITRRAAQIARGDITPEADARPNANDPLHMLSHWNRIVGAPCGEATDGLPEDGSAHGEGSTLCNGSPAAPPGSNLPGRVKACRYRYWHGTWHKCNTATCTEASQFLRMYTACDLPFIDPSQPCVDVAAHCEPDPTDAMLLDAEIEKLLATGVITAHEGDADVLHKMPVFMARKFRITGDTEATAALHDGDMPRAMSRAATVAAQMVQTWQQLRDKGAGEAAAVRETVKRFSTEDKRRFVYDGRGISNLMHSIPFRLPGVDDLLSQLTPGMYLGCLDVKSGFYHIVLSRSAGKRIGFRWGGKVYEWLRQPFGTSAAPASFVILTAELMSILRANGHNVLLVYVDDLVIAGNTKKEVDDALKRIAEIFEDIGVVLSAPKTKWGAQRQVILGLDLDTTSNYVTVPAEKAFTPLVMVQFIRHLLSLPTSQYRGFFPLDLIRSLTGKLNWIGGLNVAARAHMHTWWYACYQRGDTISPSTHAQLRTVYDLPSTLAWWCNSRHWVTKQLLARPASIPLTSLMPAAGERISISDASGEAGFGAVCQGKAIWGKFNPSFLREGCSSGIVELYGILAGIIQFGGDMKDGWALLNNDNSATTAAIMKGTSNVKRMRSYIRSLYNIAELHNVNIVARHVPRQSNTISDLLSKSPSINAAQLNLDAYCLSCRIPQIKVIHAPKFKAADGEVVIIHICQDSCKHEADTHPCT